MPCSLIFIQGSVEYRKGNKDNKFSWESPFYLFGEWGTDSFVSQVLNFYPLVLFLPLRGKRPNYPKHNNLF